MTPCCSTMRLVFGVAVLVLVGLPLTMIQGDTPPPLKKSPTAAKKAATEQSDHKAGEYVIAPYDILRIQVPNALPDQPISGEYLVQPDGRVRLGWGYGSVAVADRTLDEAVKAIDNQLKTLLREPYTFVDVAAYNGRIVKALEEVQRRREEVAARRAQMQEAESRLELAEGRLEQAKLMSRLMETRPHERGGARAGDSQRQRAGKNERD